MTTEKELRMSFDPNTIQHLGIKMYSSLPTAIAELVANAYDACSPEVHIKLYDNDEKKIIVEDTGIGMTFEEINTHFLRIGRNRREEEGKGTICGRIATGKKGLGKLAFFGIGDTIEITTTKKDVGKKIIFTLDWNDLIGTPSGEDYKPKYEDENCETDKHGTSITLLNLKRKTKFSVEPLANSLAKLFDFPDEDFKVIIYLNNERKAEIDNKSKYREVESEFEWKFPEFSNEISLGYKNKSQITGKVVTTEKPLKPGMRGITLFANGRMINMPEFFGSSQSSHFFSYVTGWLDVDFVDNWDEDVISTNRKSVNWDYEKTTELKEFLIKCLAQIQNEWREKRKEKRTKEINKKTQINLEGWYKKLPSEVRNKVGNIITPVIEESELPERKQSEVVETLHGLIPEYPYYHWRHLHPRIQVATKDDYEKEDYYRAFLEAAKRYINSVRNKSASSNNSECSMMGEVFGKNNSKLTVTKKYTKPDGSNFAEDTKNNIEEGQKFLSMGVVSGARNPVSHEEIKDLKESGLFTQIDCLDSLSLLSHLYKRLENSEKRGE